MKIGITFGVFDCLHIGHINLFNNAKKECDYLIVAIQNDNYVSINKPGTILIDSFSSRKEKVLSIPAVDEVIEYKQIDQTIKKVNVNSLFVGEDQINEHFLKAIEWCQKNNIEIIRMRRTPGVSSSDIRNKHE